MHSTSIAKRLLLAEQKASVYFALCAAVVATPEASDGELILSAHRKLFVGDESQAKAVDAMHALKNARFLTSDQIEELAAWANSFENQDPSLPSWIDQFS